MRINLCSVLVDDQAKAHKFYTEVLGFVTRKDQQAGEFRWLTVAAPEDPAGAELLLEPTAFPPAQAYQQALRQAGIPAVSFGVADMRAEHARLSALGVVFATLPTKQDWGWSASFDDTCGNLIHLHQV